MTVHRQLQGGDAEPTDHDGQYREDSLLQIKQL